MPKQDPLDRHQISMIQKLLDAHIKRMQPYKNESPDLFAFRQSSFYIVKRKLAYMFEEAPVDPMSILTTSRDEEYDTHH